MRVKLECSFWERRRLAGAPANLELGICAQSSEKGRKNTLIIKSATAQR